MLISNIELQNFRNYKNLNIKSTLIRYFKNENLVEGKDETRKEAFSFGATNFIELLAIHYYITYKNEKIYIVDGYPWGFPIDDNSERTGLAASVAKERRDNADKILSGWKQFVDELKKEGKYIEN